MKETPRVRLVWLRMERGPCEAEDVGAAREYATGPFPLHPKRAVPTAGAERAKNVRLECEGLGDPRHQPTTHGTTRDHPKLRGPPSPEH